jgi:hypothetical protein
MTLGDDPFRKRDAPPPPQDPGNPPPYASQPYGTPPQGSQPYGSQQYGYPTYPPQYPPYGSPYGPPGQPPSGHLGWAITAIIFFWPLAIAAFINYSRVEGRWYRGDFAGAQQASDAVKRYGVIALCVGLAIIVLYIILFAVAFSTTSTCTGFNC